MDRKSLVLVLSLVGCGTPSGDKTPDPGGVPDAGSCGAFGDATSCLGDDACDWVSDGCAAATGPGPALVGTYTVDEGSRATLRLVEPAGGVSRATLVLNDEVSFGARIRVGAQSAVRVDTSAPHCLVASCDWQALVLDGVLDADQQLLVTARDAGGNPLAGWEELRFAPHDGVKPVMNPQVDYQYDPHPIAGDFEGDAYFAHPNGTASGSCAIRIKTAGALEVLQCGTIEGGQARWDEERQLVNAVLAPGLLLVATVEPDGALHGLVAAMELGEVVIGPDDVSYEELVGMIDMFEQAAP